MKDKRPRQTLYHILIQEKILKILENHLEFCDDSEHPVILAEDFSAVVNDIWKLFDAKYATAYNIGFNDGYHEGKAEKI